MKEKVNKPLDLVQSALEQDDDFSLEPDDIFQPEDEGEDDKLTNVRQRKTDVQHKGQKTKVSEPMLDVLPDIQSIVPKIATDAMIDTVMKVVEPKVVKPKKIRTQSVLE